MSDEEVFDGDLLVLGELENEDDALFGGVLGGRLPLSGSPNDLVFPADELLQTDEELDDDEAPLLPPLRTLQTLLSTRRRLTPETVPEDIPDEDDAPLSDLLRLPEAAGDAEEQEPEAHPGVDLPTPTPVVATRRPRKADVQEKIFPDLASLPRLESNMCCACLLGLFEASDIRKLVDDARLRTEIGAGNHACMPDVSAPEGGIGCISCCDHLFHISCIRRWATTENSCPQCKRRFHAIANYVMELVTASDHKGLPTLPPVVNETPDNEEDAGPLFELLRSFIGAKRSDWQFVTKKTQECAETLTQEELQELVTEADVCQICESAADVSEMLVCDGRRGNCSNNYHWRCLGLVGHPRGMHWFCPVCIESNQCVNEDGVRFNPLVVQRMQNRYLEFTLPEADIPVPEVVQRAARRRRAQGARRSSRLRPRSSQAAVDRPAGRGRTRQVYRVLRRPGTSSGSAVPAPSAGEIQDLLEQPVSIADLRHTDVDIEELCDVNVAPLEEGRWLPSEKERMEADLSRTETKVAASVSLGGASELADILGQERPQQPPPPHAARQIQEVSSSGDPGAEAMSAVSFFANMERQERVRRELECPVVRRENQRVTTSLVLGDILDGNDFDTYLRRKRKERRRQEQTEMRERKRRTTESADASPPSLPLAACTETTSSAAAPSPSAPADHRESAPTAAPEIQHDDDEEELIRIPQLDEVRLNIFSGIDRELRDVLPPLPAGDESESGGNTQQASAPSSELARRRGELQRRPPSQLIETVKSRLSKSGRMMRLRRTSPESWKFVYKTVCKGCVGILVRKMEAQLTRHESRSPEFQRTVEKYTGYIHSVVEKYLDAHFTRLVGATRGVTTKQ